MIRGWLICLLVAFPLGAQGTAPDTVLAVRGRATVSDSLRLEADRRQGIRKTAVRRFAARLDSLLGAHLRPLVPDTQPPPPPPPPPDSGGFDGLAELPRAQVNVVTPAPSRTVRVGADLQSAINSAQPGDELVLPMGASYVGNFTFPAKTCTSWMTLRADSLPLGSRARPSTFGRAPRLRSPNAQATLTIGPSTACWRIAGLEITNSSITGEHYGLIELYGTDIILDRIYAHPNTDTSSVRRAVLLYGARNAVIDSWLSGFKSKYADSQAIACGDGPGPYLIRNNYLEAGSETVICGGADPSVAGLVPSDITIVNNHFTRPSSWQGQGWRVKNLLEFKNAQRLLIEGNIFENNWAESQDGYALLWASLNQGGGTWGNWSVVRDLTFRWNIVRNVDNGLVMSQQYANEEVPGRNFTIRDNAWTITGLIENQVGKWLLINSSFTGATIARNTVTAPYIGLQFGVGSGSWPGFTYIGNKGTAALYPFNSPAAGGPTFFATHGIPATSVTGNCIVLRASDQLWTLPGNQVVQLASQCTQGGVDAGELTRRTQGVVLTP